MTDTLRSTARTAVPGPSGLPPLLTPAEQRDRGAVVAAVAAEGWDVDLVDAVLHDEGYENLVLRTRDGWVLRFPRREAPDFARELAVLGLLAGRLPVPIPVVERTGRHRRLMAYRTLVGASFDADAYLAAPGPVRDRLTSSLADLLVAVHATPVADALALGVPRTDPAADHAALVALLPTVPQDLRDAAAGLVAALRERWVEAPPSEPEVVLHGDMHLRNTVLSEPVGTVVGLWDFSCVAVGRPTEDLRYLTGALRGFPCQVGRTDLARRVADHYGERTGLSVDVGAAAARVRAEDLLDALASGDLARVERAVLAPRV